MDPKQIVLPFEFILRLSYESLDILEIATSLPIIQYPYQSIICWGSSPKIFQFNAFPNASNLNCDKKEPIKIVVNTTQGKIIDSSTMKQIRALMADMETRAVSKEEFLTLRRLIFDSNANLVVCVFVCVLIYIYI